MTRTSGALTIGQAANALGVPGPWTLRRLEARGVLPRARRTLVTRKRYYLSSELADLRGAIKAGPRRAVAAA